MKKLKRPLLGIAFLTIAFSCSTNQELAQLDEYDDLYYTPNDRLPEHSSYESSEFVGASSAESSYYGESPYVEESGRPSNEFAEKSADNTEIEDDYYDPDYARRIDNFHRNQDPHYVYSDAFQNNMNPRFYGNMNFNSINGFNRSGFGLGMTVGNPWLGNRGCDPFFDPFCRRGVWGSPGFGANTVWGNTWGYYDPFNPWANRWNNPYSCWNNPWGNPYAWNNPFYNPWGPSVIVVDGNVGVNGFEYTSRNAINNRLSRGGAIRNTDRSNGTAGALDESKSNAARLNENRTRLSRNASSEDYYNRSSNRTRSGSSRAANSSRDITRTERPTQNTSPYTRQRSRENNRSTTNNYNRTNRSNSRSSLNSTRTRSRSNSSFSSPSRSRSTSPSYSSPSRSRSTTSSPSSSPSRSSGGSRRR